jgi:regulator of protease activity HflC (stomatin/prohibitin superfamily)
MSDDADNSSVGDAFATPRSKSKFFNHMSTGLILSLLLSIFLVVLLWHTIVIFNHPGQQGVYWSRFFGGTSDRILAEGAHFKFPWDDIIQYDIRLREHSGDLVVLSRDGLEMNVKWSMRYRPLSRSLPLLHKTIGPDYAERLVIPETISTLRQVLGNYRAEDIFAFDEKSLLEQLTATAGKKFQAYPITIDIIHVLQLRLPKDMADGIIKKLLYEQETLAYQYRIEAATAEKQRLKIQAEGLKQFEQISNVPILKWRGIDATIDLAKSPNSKIIVIGTDSKQLPLLLNSGQ